MVVDSLIASVSKYFSTLSVASLWGTAKVQLVIADDEGRQSALYESLKLSNIDSGESEAVAASYILELDATESMVVNDSKTVKKHASESHKVYTDGVKTNPTRITIVANIDATKIIKLEKFSDPSIWMYVLHSKDMGGSISEVGFDTDAKLYHILTVVTTDSGFKNTVKVQIELEEVVIYKKDVVYKFGVRQTNSVSGSGSGDTLKATLEKVSIPHFKTVTVFGVEI